MTANRTVRTGLTSSAVVSVSIYLYLIEKKLGSDIAEVLAVDHSHVGSWSRRIQLWNGRTFLVRRRL